MLTKISNKLTILCLLLSFIAGCDKNPANPESDSFSTVIVTLEDQRGYFTDDEYGSVQISGYKKNNLFFSKRISFDNKTAVFDSIPPGDYEVTYPYYEDTDQRFYILFSNDIIVESNKTIETHFVIPAEAQLQVVIMSGHIAEFEEVPIKHAEVSTVPETVTAITDENGRAVFGIIPIIPYRYSIRKNGVTISLLYGSNISSRNGVLEVIMGLSHVHLQYPVIEIISPEDNHYQSNYDIHLVGDGYDFEDDPLPDSTFTWYSSIDGELGTGREIFIDRMNMGNHIITLVCTDSHHRQTESSITLNLSFSDEETFFPLPYTGYWHYRYDTTDFSVIDNTGRTEQWSLNDLKVSADDADTRNCLMEYSITKGDTTKYCRYYVVDYYETDSENIYIAKTTEQMLIFDDENMQNEPTERLDIETIYTPHYLLIKQYLNPATENSYETSVTADISWEYRHANSYTQSLPETRDIRTTYTIGETEIIETEAGTYTTIPLVIQTADTERVWWLARGTGIVRLEYDLSDVPLTATLYDTNMESFTGNIHAKSISRASTYGRNNFRKVLKSQSGTPERMMELARILRGLCPR
ncbi:hypothetical protein ACFL50_05880 [Candidatus Latescibacterota bacterium]